MSLFGWIYFIALMLFVIFTICFCAKIVINEIEKTLTYRNFKRIIYCLIKDCKFQDDKGDYNALQDRIMYCFERQKKIKVFKQDKSLLDLLSKYYNDFCLSRKDEETLHNKREIIFNLMQNMKDNNIFFNLSRTNATAFINTAEYIKNDKKDEAIKMLTEISEKYASLLKEVKQYRTRKITVIISIITAAATMVGSIGTVISAMK